MSYKFNVGVVIPAAPGRINNLNRVLEALHNSTPRTPKEVVIVCDGWVPRDKQIYRSEAFPTKAVTINKHHPGREQPRNVGVRHLSKECNFVWFLDSDCLPDRGTLEQYNRAHNLIPAYGRILIGPYDWMVEGSVAIEPSLHNDPRWDMFNKYEPMTVFQNHLGVALGCFSGNLVWPINEFKRVGGFWNMLYAGRCEDGELGIRACAMSVPMSLVKEARCWHMGHEINTAAIEEKNSRDVPLINKRHPYIEQEGLVVVDRDGKRFDQICENCGEQINVLLYWSHKCES